ncbi:MAG: thiamine pyrophosphate-dependent dehydrogenase E1 component subunit alpha [Akkermansiaceae bacterium]|nr:thiamine pyrophosphate-dependent dehydrogenase E1 component subunit alpha [Akkermansiaceae bacterium]
MQSTPSPEAQAQGSTTPTNNEFLCSVFHSMLRARILENKLSSLYKAGKIVGGVYLGKGQEAVSATLGASLIRGVDFFAPLIRDQAGRTAFGEDMLDCTRTYLGSIEGPMRGRDGNIHRGRPTEGMPAMISHLGAQLSVLAGMLMAKRLQGKLEGRVGATCIGDGATSTGSFHEGLNMAAVEKLPLVVVVANNQFAYSTPTARQFACADLIERARGYGVGGFSVDGTDLMACASVITEAVRRARSGKGPQMIVAHLLRLSGHGEHDDGSYVPDRMRGGHYGRDCIEVAMRQLVEQGAATVEEIKTWQNDFAAEVQRAVAQAQQEANPDPYTEDWSALSTQFPLPPVPVNPIPQAQEDPTPPSQA